MTIVDSEPCVRCGDYFRPVQFYIHEIPFCVDCLTRGITSGASAARALLPSIKVLLGGCVTLTGIGLTLGLLFAIQQLGGKFIESHSGLVVFLSLVLSPLAFVASIFMYKYYKFWVTEVWRKHLIKRLGISRLISDMGLICEYATFLEAVPSDYSFSPASRTGLLLSNEHGAVFVGCDRQAIGFLPSEVNEVAVSEPGDLLSVGGLILTFGKRSIYGRRSVVLEISAGWRSRINSQRLSSLCKQFERS